MKIPSINAQLFCKAECQVGEGPFWHQQRLYWVDIFGSRMHSCDGNGSDARSITLPSHVGAVAPWEDGFIAGTKDGIGFLTHDGIFSLLPTSPHLSADMRFNDGKLDPAGRFWCGSTTYKCTQAVGALYRVERDGTVGRVLEGLTIANGLEWNEEATRFYYIDTPTQRVDAFDYDIASGRIENRRVAFDIPKEFGIPDGMARDRAGRLWVACWGGSRVVGFDSGSGRPVAQINIPTQLTSSCWVSPDSRRLFITTARSILSEQQLAREPLAGSVFCAELSA